VKAFSPDDYLMLVQREAKWFELLTRLSRRRDNYPQGPETDAIPVMVHGRNRHLRN
jgi:hypothetical protein